MRNGYNKKSKLVFWECTWSSCKLVIPESHPAVQREKRSAKHVNRNIMMTCPECGGPMQRRVYK